MATLFREAYFFSRAHFKPLLLIALIYTLPATLWQLSLPDNADETDGSTTLIASGLLICLGVVQFAAAMIFIHLRVQGQPTSVSDALRRAVSQLLPLMMVNLLMALAIATGLMMLVLPGLFLAYKLLFAEFALLFHQRSIIDSLKDSYQATRGQSEKIIPPLLVWIALVISLSVGPMLLTGHSQPQGLELILQEVLSMLVTIFGWALLYRLYQRYIAAQFDSNPSLPPGE